MVTIACTSVPPSGRNSFWYTVAVKSAIGLPCGRSSILTYVGRPVGRGRRASACHETLVGLSRAADAREGRGDVVLPADRVGERDEMRRDGVRVGRTGGGDLGSEGGRLGSVVPE